VIYFNLCDMFGNRPFFYKPTAYVCKFVTIWLGYFIIECDCYMFDKGIRENTEMDFIWVIFRNTNTIAKINLLYPLSYIMITVVNRSIKYLSYGIGKDIGIRLYRLQHCLLILEPKHKSAESKEGLLLFFSLLKY